jgi:hypothetical protein
MCPTHALVLASLLPCLEPAQLAIDAGPDQSVLHTTTVQLQGVLSGARPLDFWTADGNGPTENHLIKYSDLGGVTSVGPMQTSSGAIYGFPSDLVLIGLEVYGVDVGRRQIYTLDPDTAIVTAVGAQFASTWSSVHSLAYDPAGDRLFAVDLVKRQLLRLNYTSGAVTKVGTATLTSWPLVRSLAWRATEGMLYAVDQSSNWLLKIDPNTGQVTPVAALTPDPEARIDELEFYDGELYAMNALIYSGVVDGGQILRIDLPGGTEHAIGPILQTISPHALYINTVIEKVVWSKVSGPGSVIFDDSQALDARADFSEPGVYVLELTAFGSSGPISDTVQIDSNWGPVGTPYCFGNGTGTPCPCGNNGAAGQGCANSTGSGSVLANTGGVSVSLDDAVLTTSGLPTNVFGITYMGTQPLYAGAVLGDGLRCVGGSILRFPVKASGASGSFSVGGPVAASGGAIAAGSHWYFQTWHRDKLVPCGSQQNLSNAVAITFGP